MKRITQGISTKFGFIWLSGFEEEDFLKIGTFLPIRRNGCHLGF